MSNYLRVTSDLAAEAPILYSKFGIVGDGKTFDHAGVRNLTDALDNHGKVHLGGAPVILLGETVTLSERLGAILTTDREPYAEAPGLTPWFTWDGKSGGTMLAFDRSRLCTLDGFTFAAHDPLGARAEASIAVLTDGGPDTHGSGYGSACTFRRLRLVTSPTAKTAATLIAIGLTTKWNQDFHDVVECGGNGNFRGSLVHQGNSPNIKHTRVRKTRYADAFDRAIWAEHGSMHFAHNNLSFNEWDYYLEDASGYYSEFGHIGEASHHHAYINVPFRSSVGEWDIQAAKDGWVVFGEMAADVKIRGAHIGPPVAGSTARVFKWDADGMQRRVDIEALVDYGHTRASLGIEYATLCGGATPNLQAGSVRFAERGHTANPQGPGVLDLPSGELLFNWREPTREYIGLPLGPDWGTLPDKTPSMHTLARGPVDWSTLSPGVSVDYIDTKSGYHRRQSCFADGSYADAPIGQYKKVKP